MSISTEHSLGVDRKHEMPPSPAHQGLFAEATADSRNAVRSNVLTALTTEAVPPLTARAFTDSLRKEAQSIRLDDFQVARIPPPILEEWKTEYADVWVNPKRRDNLRGLIGELMVNFLLQSEIKSCMNQLRQVRALDIDLHNECFQVFQGPHGSDEVLIEQRGRTILLEPFMEFDSLYQINSSGEYVAFDPTFKKIRNFATEKRTEKLRTIAELLKKNIVLIDVMLTDGQFAFSHISESMKRWYLPCTIDTDDVIRQIIPRKLWGRTID
ncbi:hypothetical protein EXS65_00235 [Candidatus Peribacteria bacterium]|nr:hypothetical protein [Candidatus Peribacteria bacterium]